MEQVACNLCGSTQLTPVYEMPDTRFFPDEIFTAVECNHCGLGFVNPRPTLAEMAKYYPCDYYQAQPPMQPDDLPPFMRKRFQAKVRFLADLERRSGPRKLLDVGAGNGDFARFMLHRGWQVEAVEISEHSARIPEFPVYADEFQNIPVNAPAYDAITIWAVLEHVHDPMAYFRKAAQVLKPDGRLVFLVTNFHSMASRHLFGEDIPRHLYFFTRETVAQYLQKNGLHLESEDNGRSIYKMAPAHWLSYLIQTRLRGKPYTFAEVPLSSRAFRRVHGLSKGIGTSLKYFAYSPSSVVERVLFPAVEAVQILRKTYGISTYVARKA
ncbi:MAG TPA: class I SAM-dependent methyltransferase [Verrucomicrobiae bacterium]|nr:class I SAM-dependent methyltransferase [Verrucomicrobiae bacterium]